MLNKPGSSSGSSSLSSSHSQITNVLEKAEKSLHYEEARLAEYNAVGKALENEVKYLTKEFLISETKFVESKALLLNSKPDLLKVTHEIQALLSMMKYPTDKEPTSVYALIKNFHYKNLSDETIEKLIPIWKAENRRLDGQPNAMISFISASIESKMKSDLLNSAGNKLHQIINRIEVQKISLTQTAEKVRKLKAQLHSFTQDDLNSFACSQEDWDNDYIKNDIWLHSEDLYGLDFERGDTSTIIYQRYESNCTSCTCFTF